MMNRTEHLLVCLMEECDEVGQRCSKALRFSLSEVQPGQPLSNAERIVGELKDLITIAEMLVECGAIPDFTRSFPEVAAKAMKVEKFMELARAQGVLEPLP